MNLVTSKDNTQVSELKLSLASARPVFYYSVYRETLQINGVCTTPGKALGFELIPLPAGDELIASPQAPVTLSATAEQQGRALANTAQEAISELCIDSAHIQHAGWTSSLASARPVYYYSV